MLAALFGNSQGAGSRAAVGGAKRDGDGLLSLEEWGNMKTRDQKRGFIQSLIPPEVTYAIRDSTRRVRRARVCRRRTGERASRLSFPLFICVPAWFCIGFKVSGVLFVSPIYVLI